MKRTKIHFYRHCEGLLRRFASRNDGYISNPDGVCSSKGRLDCVASLAMTQTQTGFTLLEMMLVLAIIAVMLLAGLSGWDQMIMNQKIQKASVEMQMWMQAGIKYYAENGGQIPDNSQQIIDAGLMSKASINNPWNVDGGPGTYNVTSLLNAKTGVATMQVSTVIPANVNYSASIARMLAGNLPFGVNPEKTTEVYMNIVPPAGIVDPGTAITEILTIKEGETPPIKKPPCQTLYGSNYEPEIYYALNSVNTIIGNTSYALGKIRIDDLAPFGADYWQPYANVLVGRDSSGKAGITAIVMCVNQNSPKQAENKSNSNYVF